jgi:DNA-binding LacI/PurR family transcriptional regulator
VAATISDVAKLAQVSIKTVSNVLHDYPHLRPETRSRVQDAIEALGYELNLHASSLRSGQAQMITIHVPNPTESASIDFVEELVRLAEDRGVHLTIERP